MHSLVISGAWHIKERENATLHAVFKDFSDRHLELRTEPEDKFAYVWLLFCQGIKFPFSRNHEYKVANEEYYKEHWPRQDVIDGKFSKEELEERDKFYDEKVRNVNTKYTSFEKVEIQKRFNTLVKYLDDLSNYFLTEHSPVHIDFDDLDYEIYDYGYVSLASKSEVYPETGCYGNDGVIAYFEMQRAWDVLNKYLDTGVESNDNWYVQKCISEMIDFAFNPNSILIQNTDECDDDDREKHYKTVTEYVIKNEGRATVIHPLGG